MLFSPGGSKAMSGSETEPPLLYIRLDTYLLIRLEGKLHERQGAFKTSRGETQMQDNNIKTQNQEY